MIDLRKNSFRVSTVGAALLAAAGFVAVPAAAGAAEWSSLFLSTNKVEYIDNFVNSVQNAAIRDDDIRLSTNNQLIATGRLQDGIIVRVAGRLQYFQHVDRTDQDNLLLGGFADVGKRFGALFARVGYFGDYRRKDGNNQYIENGADFTARYAPNRSYALTANVRGSYRDFDENNFPGLDQTRIFASARAFWYPFQDRTFLMAETGLLDTNADTNFQSNLLYFVGARAGYHINKKASIGLRAKYSNKEFDAGNPAVQGGITREDDIFEVFGRVDYKFSKNVTGFAEAGVVDQQSNINTQDFTGPRVGVGVKLLFSTAK
ncbi:outer membrane beta-barrel protein [Minwuia sp.]|uniref:outer membrane beta-barrel protein n=1 Tax=Minwuia sp. TaxID=2493630 RepID=UPI003A8EF5CE